MTVFLYKIAHIASGKCYVGVTFKNPLQRVCEHYIYDSELGRDMRNDGIQAFRVHLLGAYATRDEAESAESFVIADLAPAYNTYKGHCEPCPHSPVLFTPPLMLAIDDDITALLCASPSLADIQAFFGYSRPAPSPVFAEVLDAFLSSQTIKYAKATRLNYASAAAKALKSRGMTLADYKAYQGKINLFDDECGVHTVRAMKALDIVLGRD
jgi:hypothetical protein